MNRFAIYLLGLGLTLSAVACVGNPRFRMPSAEEIRVKIHSEFEVDALERGRAIAITDCADCHRVYWPSEYTPERWVPILEEMGARSSLTDEEIAALTEYVVGASEITRAQSTGTEPLE